MCEDEHRILDPYALHGMWAQMREETSKLNQDLSNWNTDLSTRSTDSNWNTDHVTYTSGTPDVESPLNQEHRILELSASHGMWSQSSSANEPPSSRTEEGRSVIVANVLEQRYPFPVPERQTPPRPEEGIEYVVNVIEGRGLRVVHVP